MKAALDNIYSCYSEWLEQNESKPNTLELGEKALGGMIRELNLDPSLSPLRLRVMLGCQVEPSDKSPFHIEFKRL